MKKLIILISMFILLSSIIYAGDSTNPADYFFYDDMESGVISDNYNSGVLSYSTNRAVQGTKSLAVGDTSINYASSIKTTVFTSGESAIAYCVDFWGNLDRHFGSSNQEQGLKWGTTWIQEPTIFINGNVAGCTLGWVGMSSPSWTCFGNAASAPVDVWAYYKFCFDYGVGSGDTNFTILGPDGTSYNSSIGTFATDRANLGAIAFHNRILSGNIMYIDMLRIWDKTVYGTSPPPSVSLTVDWDALPPTNATTTDNLTMDFSFEFSGDGLIDGGNCTFYEEGISIGTMNNIINDTVYKFTQNNTRPYSATEDYYIECEGDNGLMENSSTKTITWDVGRDIQTYSNLSTSRVSSTQTINVYLSEQWDETATCKIVDNVTWVSCLPATEAITNTTNATFTCFSDNITTGDVDVYAQCSSSSYPLINTSFSYTYTVFNFNSMVADAIIYLPFNNTIADFSVNLVTTWMENNGVASSPSYGVGGFGFSNTALATSLTDYLSLTKGDMSFTESNSINFWVDGDDSFSTDNGVLADTKFGKVVYSDTTTTLVYTVNNGGVDESVTHSIDLTTGYNMITAICNNASNTMALYINTTEVNSSGSINCMELA